MIPSIKTLSTITDTPEDALLLRRILTFAECGGRAELENLLHSSDRFPGSSHWYSSCFHRPPRYLLALYMADEILRTCGVEGVPAGHNAKSPAFDYCNTGDSYDTTLLHIAGRGFRVGCWGDLVERGSYD